jgi:hypothetical protein
MKKLLQKLNRWFELKLGWFFTNGRKQDAYREYLIDKYIVHSNDNYIDGQSEYYQKYYEMMKERENPTPANKAKALVDKMYYTISNNGSFKGENSIPHKWEEAKQCAIIAVEEIERFVQDQMQGWLDVDFILYLGSIKKEIKKL